MRQLDTLGLDELWTLYKNNEGFSKEVYHEAAFLVDELLSEAYEDILGRSRANGVDYNNHYDSFYLTLRSAELLVDQLRDADLESHLSDDTTKAVKDLIARCNALEEEGEEDIDGALELEAAAVLKKIEEELHALEGVAEEDIKEILVSIVDGYSWMSGWMTDGTIVMYTTTTTLK